MTTYVIPQPMDFRDATAAGHRLAERRRTARASYEAALVAAAEAKHDYRKALAIAHVSAVGDNAAHRTADAQSRAAEAERKRDISEGMVKAQLELLNEVDGERATFHRLVEWSMKLDPYALEDRSPPAKNGPGVRR